MQKVVAVIGPHDAAVIRKELDGLIVLLKRAQEELEGGFARDFFGDLVEIIEEQRRTIDGCSDKPVRLVA